MNKIFRIVWSQATQSWVVVSELTKAHKKQSSSNSQGSAVKFSGNFIKSSAIALTLLSGNAAYAANAAELLIQINSTGGVATASGSDSIAIGKSSKATADSAVALGEAANANQARAVAIGKGATISSGQDTIAIGTDTNVQGHTSIVIGKNAKTTNTAEGTVVIGRDAFSEGSGNGGRPNTVVGRGAYTAFGEKGTYRLNAATALGFQAGSGIRVDSKNNNKLVNNETNADSNENVLVKAGYGLQNIQDAAQKVEMDKTKAFLQAGFAHNGLDKTGDSGKSTDIANGLSFYRKNHINEATAIGAEARAIGDQSIAIGGQVVAGDGVVALGGNDTDALRSNKYQVVTADAVNSTKVGTIDDFNLAYTESNRDVAGQYNYLVGRPMPTGYRSTYGQSGSVVIGMEAHSTTALGTAIGTNSVVRMGAFGATAIGAGSTVQPNAEAAVAIGMGSVANGAYALAGGTASWADYGDIALGYQAKATGKDGAIAMGRATNAQGDSSIMIGGANIESASKQTTTFEKAKPGEITKKTVTEKINGHDVDREYTFAATDKTVGTVAQAYKELTGRNMDTSAINFADTTNKNGHASTSLGVHALAKGDLGTAIGASSRAEAIGSVALGTGARATRQNAVAIGTGSTTDLVGTRQLSVNYNSDGEIVSDNSKDIAYTFKWAGGTNTSEGDVVSFGSSGAERQLKNVAAGRVAEDSTDAINGSQLNSITKKIAAGFNTSGNVVTGSSGEFTSKQKNANVDSAKKDYETAIRSEDKVQFQVGNNLKLDRDETEVEVEVPDDFNKNQKVKKKIRKADFAYSLNPVLTNLTSAEFKGSDTAPTTKLTNAGVTITPVTAGKSPVSLTENGLNNGGNAITDVAGNLEGAKTGTTAPKNKADKPANADTIKNNAATVGDVLNAGWNLQEKGAAKDFVTAYDTVNFVDGDGTSVSVTTNTDGKISEIKYSANLGDGLEKDATTNKIKVKAADNTLTTDDKGLKVNTGEIEPVTTGTNPGTVKVKDNDAGKIATVDSVVNAVNSAAWTATSAATTAGELGKEATNQLVKAGDKVTFEADKNIKITQEAGKFTFATKENVTFNTVQVGGDQGPKLSKSDAGDLKVSGPNSTDPVKVTNVKDGDISADSKDAINGSQFHKLANNTIQLKGQTGNNAVTETNKQALNKENGIAFTVKSSDGTLLEVTAADDTITLTPKTATLTTTDGVPTANTTGGKLVTADQLISALTEMGWKATADKDGSGTVSGAATELIKAGNTVTFKAGDNLAVKQDGKNFIYSLQKELTGLTSAEFKNQAGDKTVINSDGMKITPKDAPANPVSLTKDGLDNGGKTVKNVTSGLTNYAEGTPKAGLVDLSKPATGNPTVPDTTAATVGDLRNMGWVVSSDKTTGELTKAYTDQVKNADEVKFVGEGGVTVSGKTENGVRTITVKAEAQEMPEQPVSYTTADGTKVYPKTVTKPDGSKETKYYPNPDGTGTEIPKENVIASINGPEGTKAPTTLSNVAGNLDGAKKDTKVPTTEHGPVNTTDKNADNYVNPNNAATVGDVLNAGWNLQNNGEARDFVKPYDTVNFVDGLNTKAVVTTDAEGKVSNVQIDVKDLPIAYTNEAGDKVVKAADGKYYKESDLAGKVYDPKTNKFKNADGTALANQPTEVAGNTVKTNLVNPNAEANKAGNATQLGNVASGANTFASVEDKKLGNDGKWYPADQVEPNGQPKKDASPVAVPNNIGKAGLIDFSKSNPNNAATVGDLQNLGWVVSAKGNDYSDQVRNANEVKFVGEGTASVTGKTDENGVRTITVKVDDQVSTNNSATPVVYTDKDGKTVYPIKDDKGNVTYHTTPDGKGQDDKVVPNSDVNTSINGPKDDQGNTRPASLSNVKNNIPAVNDADKKVTNTDGTDKPNAGDVANINKAPLTAEEAADLLKPTTKDGKANPNFVGNNAATVSDVLNAGWNLQGNGSAVDFVKPYDTVNFINGKGTKAVVETADNLTSTVKFDVDAGEITSNTNGSVSGPTTAENAKKLADDLANAQNAVNNLAPDADDATKKAAQDALKAAQDAAAPLNKVATAQNVANMINQSGWNATSAATTGGEVSGTTKELINPSETVTFEAGKNISITQAENKFTFATKDNVEFNTVKVGGDANTYVDDKGNPVTKKEDGSFEDAEGNKVDAAKVSPVAPVTLKTEKASPANNNAEGNHPTTALNISSGTGADAKPTQLKGVGSVLSTKEQPTSTGKQGDTPATAGNQNLVNLGNNPITGKSDLAPEILNSAATVGDLANMGWVVSTKDGNGYKDVVKNANQVDFVGKNGITVTGETKDGIRTITVETAQSPVVYTDKEGNKLVKAGDNFFYPADSVVFGDEAYPAGSVVIGGKVYPKGTTPEQVTAGTATPATALTNGKKPADVIASMNNGDDKSANAPMQLGNVAQGAETIAPVDADGNKLVKANDGKYYPEGKVKADGSLEDGTTDADVKQPLKLANDGKWYPADQISAKGVPAENAKAVTPPATMDPKAGLVDFANSNPNNAATVGDLQNMGWIVGAPTNGYTDQVRNTNKVNFVGTGIATVTGETDAKGVRTITVNVANGLVDVAKNEADTATGAVTGPKKAAEDALKAAKAKLDELNNKPTATEEEKKAAQDAVNKAQSAVNNAPNLVATAQNVADMINKSGFNLKTSAAEGQKVKGTKDEGELINPGATVEMVAGKNMSVKQDENGKVTYATKDDVEFNTVKIANPNGATYTDKNNNPLVKADDGKFYPADQVENGKVKDPAKATPVDADKVTTKAAPSVEFKAEKATPATNNTGKDKDGKTVEPTTALNISSDDGKPTQLKGVGSVLNTADVKTSTGDQRDTDGNIEPAQQGTDKLVDLGTNPKKGDKPLSEETLNSAATVRDLANMGWVVSAKDNNYTNTVKNANKVEFKGGAGISVKGETTTDGVREITISVKDGEVVKPNQFIAKVNGKDTPVIKVGDQYYNIADIDPKTGKPKADPKANVTPVTPDAGTTPTNAGDGYVTGNKVATAIQKSGFVVGKQTEKLSAADFNDKDEKVNPDDELRFADGNNTKVKLATKESVDKDGNKVTTTTVKVDVTGLPVQYTDKNGTLVTKVGDEYFTVDDKGNPTTTEVKPADLTTNMVNPAAAPNVIGAPTALGNVKSNLPSVNDADKNAKDVAGNPIAGKDNKSAPITATEAADLLNLKTADGKANPKFAGNNAATVSDVLNTGWNLQNNGEAKDFVKPYDTVNFVDGKGTKAVVETTPNGTTSNVKFDIDTGKITNNDDGSVQGPVTPEMQKALKDAKEALNSLPTTAPEAVRKAAEQAVADAENNIANAKNKVATAQDVADAINKSGFTLTTSANGGEKISGTPEVINPGKKVEMVAGKNMTVKQESNGKVTYATASNVTFDSVQFGDKGPKITNKAGNINVSGPDGKTPTKITGVAPGEISATSKDAINGSQLHAVASNLNNKINKVGKHADAGTASALAAANIPQAYTPGKSLVGIAAGNYQGQNGLAVGMSRISDNGKIIIRLSGTANSQGKTGVAAGVGYQW